MAYIMRNIPGASAEDIQELIQEYYEQYGVMPNAIALQCPDCAQVWGIRTYQMDYFQKNDVWVGRVEDLQGD